MFSYLHAIVSSRGVYAATDDFGSQTNGAVLGERIARAASDYARLVRGCGSHHRRDSFSEETAAMERLLGGGRS